MQPATVLLCIGCARCIDTTGCHTRAQAWCSSFARAPVPQDIQLLLAAQCHLGTKNCDHQMERYVYKRRNDGIYIINLGKTWEKLQLAARVIVAIENPQDIVVQSARPYGQRAILKFAHYVNAKALSGRHTPGEQPAG